MSAARRRLSGALCRPLGARHGHRRTFVLDGGVFAPGALSTTFAPSLPFVLVGWSLLQGLGVALMLPALPAMLTASFTGAIRTKVLSTLAVTSGIGAAAGPVLGGLLTNYQTWRMSFLLGAAVTLTVSWLTRRTSTWCPTACSSWCRSSCGRPWDSARCTAESRTCRDRSRLRTRGRGWSAPQSCPCCSGPGRQLPTKRGQAQEKQPLPASSRTRDHSVVR
ncbi:MFS transporter [Streptomyces sp. NPDC017958]|uniref:MFS transporter n=1 Tax=Streptomyces sp. NPDC017958 TaxID=3365021 RepID=UPI0037A793AE